MPESGEYYTFRLPQLTGRYVQRNAILIDRLTRDINAHLVHRGGDRKDLARKQAITDRTLELSCLLGRRI